jgi:hypothetical protein
MEGHIPVPGGLEEWYSNWENEKKKRSRERRRVASLRAHARKRQENLEKNGTCADCRVAPVSGGKSLASTYARKKGLCLRCYHGRGVRMGK